MSGDLPGALAGDLPGGPRLIVANLDCELTWAPPGAPRVLPEPVMRRIAAAGTLLGALGRASDRVWTPAPVDPARVARGAFELAAGDLHVAATAPRPARILAWGETAAVARLRPRSEPRNATSSATSTTAGRDDSGADAAWLAALWDAAPGPEAARRANDRRVSAALAQRLGVALPGAAIVSSVAALEDHIAAGGADASPDGAWVVKAPWSASGRTRLRRRGPLDQPSRTRARRLLAHFGALCFEPWVPRLADLGCLGVVRAGAAPHIFAPHGLLCDRAGVFRGVVTPAPDIESDSLSGTRTHAQLRQAAEAAAHALSDLGYRGPFGVDGFVYPGPRGPTVQPVCEINARLSFGFVALALRASLGLTAGDALTLRLDAAPIPPPSGDREIIPLLYPTARDPTCAWLELTAA